VHTYRKFGLSNRMIASCLRRGERGQPRWQILRRVKVGKKLRVEQKANGRSFFDPPILFSVGLEE
jgi:hypothetical protein